MPMLPVRFGERKREPLRRLVTFIPSERPRCYKDVSYRRGCVAPGFPLPKSARTRSTIPRPIRYINLIELTDGIWKRYLDGFGSE